MGKKEDEDLVIHKNTAIVDFGVELADIELKEIEDTLHRVKIDCDGDLTSLKQGQKVEVAEMVQQKLTGMDQYCFQFSVTTTATVDSILDALNNQLMSSSWKISITSRTNSNMHGIIQDANEPGLLSSRTEFFVIGLESKNTRDLSKTLQTKVHLFLGLKMSNHNATYNVLLKFNQIIDDLLKTGVDKNLLCRECLSLSFEEENKIIGTFGLKNNFKSSTVCSRDHYIYPSDEQFFSGIVRDFEYFTCPPGEEISILDNAIKISCKETPLTVKTRLCQFEQWEAIESKLKENELVSSIGCNEQIVTLFLQSILGPIVEMELVSPADKIPEGVKISVKHFLTLPNSAEVISCLESEEDQHNIVKITKIGEDLNIEKFGDFRTVNTEHFETYELQNQSLCYPPFGKKPNYFRVFFVKASLTYTIHNNVTSQKVRKHNIFKQCFSSKA
jgi:hypothetical protein